jgi:PIN domain nuclease of toxin-antitoxin system
LQNLPFYHQDPFDRLIISQAQAEDYTIITHDDRFKQYDVKLL